ncbi:retinitis pigmentosa 1-like 1 protein isoform X3 [Chiloscyllium plagiosum]|uniref:retinitis pigmentosa 1-like 1 protein isoform X3 n=1 Tax=Chiloscyllium plagiosum TaxID=36176 RepID=UPI001CB87AF7|nr:retinitis pigmentosa 1-like 1 protein isoform X3 [Chiloscyllium plagiosum]
MEILLFCVVIIFFTSLVGPLEVEIFPAPLEVLANEDALLKCKYKEPESDLSHVAVRWTFTSQTAKKDVYIFNGGKHQPIRNGAKMFDNALQKGNASLYLPNVQRYEEGTYTCVVFVTPHKEEKSSVMQVSVQPKVSMSVQEISTANGTEHVLQCDVKEFYPKPIKVSWFKLSDGKMEYVSTSQSTEDIVTNSDGTFSVSTKIKTEPTWDEQTDYRCVVEHKTISDNFTLDADSVADKIPAVYQIIGGIVGFILCVGLCVGLRIWYKKSKETQEIRTGKDSHKDRTMQVIDRITQGQLQDEHNQEAEGGNNQGPPSPEESENCPLIPVQQRVADIEQKTQEMRTGKDSHEDRTMQVTDRSTQDQLQDENNQGAEGGINQEGPPSPEESENCPLIPVQQRVADIEQRQSTPKKNENNIGQAVTSSRRKTQEIHRGKESHEDRKMQVTDHLIQDQSQDVHNQEAEGEINQEETQEIHTGKDSHEDRTMQVTDRSTQDQLQDENNQGAEGGINQEETQEIRTGEVIQDDRTMQVTDHLIQDQLQDEHNQEAEGGITQEETQEIRTGKESHKDRTMEVTDHINQDQSQDENKQEAEGGINPEETQKIHTGKDSHEDRTMQVTDRITQDQLQDEHNQGAEGGINQEGPPSPEESENCPLIPVKQRVAVIERRQSTPKKNENNIGQAVTSSRRKTQEIRTGKESHKDRTMEVTDHINQDQSQDENKQEAEGGINPEESPNHS